MLDKASRSAAGPPHSDPGTTGPGFLRRFRRPRIQATTVSAAGSPAAEVSDPESGDRDQVDRDYGPVTNDTAALLDDHSVPDTADPGPADTEPATSTVAAEPEELRNAGNETAPSSLDRAATTGGGLVIAPGWRERAATLTRRPHYARLGLLPKTARRAVQRLPKRLPSRDELVELAARRPSSEQIGAAAREHRYLLAVLVVILLFMAGDGGTQLTVTDRAPGAGIAYPVPVAHPLRLALPTPSVRRYLDAIDTGERLREQAVVAAAARATLERAKAEAAAAAAGQDQPWIHSAPAPGPAAGGIIPPGAVPPGPTGYVLPAVGTFTSGFGSRWGSFHRGIDIAGPIGTPIYAVANGTVIDAGPAAGFGLWVRIRHDDGTVSVYGHLYDFFVSVGERVPAGMQIARMGNRGDSTGPHLHFEIIMDGRHVDPQAWLALHNLSYG